MNTKIVTAPPHMAPFSAMMEWDAKSWDNRHKFAGLAEAIARMELKSEHVAEVCSALDVQIGRFTKPRGAINKSICRALTQAREQLVERNRQVRSATADLQHGASGVPGVPDGTTSSTAATEAV